MRFRRDVVTKYGSNLVRSAEECCHSALSENLIVYRMDAFESPGAFFVMEILSLVVALVDVRISAR